MLDVIWYYENHKHENYVPKLLMETCRKVLHLPKACDETQYFTVAPFCIDFAKALFGIHAIINSKSKHKRSLLA